MRWSNTAVKGRNYLTDIFQKHFADLRLDCEKLGGLGEPKPGDQRGEAPSQLRKRCGAGAQGREVVNSDCLLHAA